MLPVTAINCCDRISPCLPRYWYGLPPWPTGQFAWRRQLDASYTYAIATPPVAITRVSPAYYVELRALDIAKNEVIAAIQTERAEHERPVKLRWWPFRVESVAAKSVIAAYPEQTVGSLIDFVA